jgi:hypothetical protein
MQATAGTKINPSTGTILADSGAFTRAMNAEVHLILRSSGPLLVRLEKRDAADATLETQDIKLLGRRMVVLTTIPLVAIGQRVVVVTAADLPAGNAEAMLKLEQKGP